MSIVGICRKLSRFARNPEQKGLLLPPPSVRCHSEAIAGRLFQGRTGELSGKFAHVALGHQGLTGTRLIGGLGHTGHKPPLGSGGFKGQRHLCPTTL